jgi:hypothetical protein
MMQQNPGRLHPPVKLKGATIRTVWTVDFLRNLVMSGYGQPLCP